MDDSAPRLTYSPDDGTVILQLGGPALTVDGLTSEVEFEQMSPEGETTLALWLDRPQADVLAKMIAYIVEKVAIKAESKQLLQDLLPQVEALVTRHDGG